MDIWQKVFGKIGASMVIGAAPDLKSMEKELKLELESMRHSADSMSRSELESARERQIRAEELVNSRPGAMATSQEKIRTFTKYSRMYVEFIDEKIRQKKK